MRIVIGSDIRIYDPVQSLVDWARQNMTVRNAQYDKNIKLGYSVWNVPETVSFYKEYDNGKERLLILPYGSWRYIRDGIPASTDIRWKTADHGLIDYGNRELPLYDYQQHAVNAMVKAGGGVLIGPCGSGKTQVGIGIVMALKRKALWVTHTNDLVEQSFSRAERYMPAEWIGKITAGNVEIGSHLTVATVQTLSRLDLSRYKKEWDVVIVDECHRVCGSAHHAQMFYKVVSSLAAPFKYGLTATLHRSDGMTAAIPAILGGVGWQIPETAVSARVITPTVVIRFTDVREVMDYLDKHGEVQFSSLVNYLASDPQRNRQIVSDILNENNKGRSSLILSDRISHLQNLIELFPDDERNKCVMIDGKMQSKAKREERQQAIDQMRSGEKKYLFATYGLAREGLDIPCLERLYLATPKSDYAVIKQSLGRISRTSPGKTSAICYDYVDKNIGMLSRGLYPKRARIYEEMKLQTSL